MTLYTQTMGFMVLYYTSVMQNFVHQLRFGALRFRFAGFNEPRGSIYITIVELGLKGLSLLWFWGVWGLGFTYRP